MVPNFCNFHNILTLTFSILHYSKLFCCIGQPLNYTSLLLNFNQGNFYCQSRTSKHNHKIQTYCYFLIGVVWIGRKNFCLMDNVTCCVLKVKKEYRNVKETISVQGIYTPYCFLCYAENLFSYINSFTLMWRINFWYIFKMFLYSKNRTC